MMAPEEPVSNPSGGELQNTEVNPPPAVPDTSETNPVPQPAGGPLSPSLFYRSFDIVLAGWLHPFAEQRRLSWSVEPDPALVHAAEKMQAWYSTNQLPESAHGLILNIDLANYCPWFAPSVKNFIDFRWNMNQGTLADYILLRRALVDLSQTDKRPARDDVEKILDAQHE